MNVVRTLGAVFAVGHIWLACLFPLPALAGEYDDVLNTIRNQNASIVSDVDTLETYIYRMLYRGLSNQDVVQPSFATWKPMMQWANNRDLVYPYFQNQQYGFENDVSTLPGMLRMLDADMAYVYGAVATNVNLTEDIDFVANSNLVLQTIMQDDIHFLRTNKWNTAGDMNIVTNFLIAESYRPITDPIGGWYDDYSQFLEMLTNPDYIDTYMYYYGPWRYHLLNYLSYLPVGSAGGQSMDSLYLRPGEASYINELYLNTESGHDTRYSWAYYDLYGTGEILRTLTNNLGLASSGTSAFGLTSSNTVTFSESTIKDIKETSESSKETILGTNNIEVASTDFDDVTNSVPEEIEEMLEELTEGEDSAGGAIDEKLVDLAGDFTEKFDDVKSSFDGASSDCRIDANFDITFSDEASFSSDGQWYIDLGENVDDIVDKDKFNFLVKFFVWIFKTFIVLEYAFKAFRRVMESL